MKKSRVFIAALCGLALAGCDINIVPQPISSQASSASLPASSSIPQSESQPISSESSESDPNPLGLEFFLINDHEYGVGVGRAKYYEGKIVIPASHDGLPVTRIVENGFEGAFLTEIEIPSFITSIGKGAFAGCTLLESLSLPFVGESASSIGSKALMGYIFGEDHFEGGVETKQYYVPDSDVYATYYVPSSLRSVKVTGETLESGAFCNCSTLTSIEIGYGVTSIGYSTFSYCSSLTSIALPDSVTYIGRNAFYGCSSLTSITIPDSVTSIGGGVFCRCSSLTSIEIPSSVASIGPQVFQNCTSLSSIFIPSSVVSFEGSGFIYCASLTIYCEAESRPSGWADNWNDERPVIWGHKGVTESGGIRYGLGKNEGKPYATVIGCDPSLAKATIAGEIDGRPVTSIGDSAFRDCLSLSSVVIPFSVSSIGNSAFCGCSSLTSVEIPDGVTFIGNNVFYGCSSLVSIEIPDSVASIGRSAFYGCSSLTSVEIPSPVTSIDEYTFYGCSALQSVAIPSSVTSIGDSAFSGCSSLQYSHYENALYLGNADNPYMVLVGVENKDLASCAIHEGCKMIGERAFSNCSSLASVTIPDSVTSIGDNAFSGCTSLASVEIPSSVPSIGDWAFFYCSALTSVEIPSSVATIGSWAFNGCSSLVIRCEAESKPSGWYDSWNDGRPVIWGYKGTAESDSIRYGLGEIGGQPYATVIGCDPSLNEANIAAEINGYPVVSIADGAFSGRSSLISVTTPSSATSIGNYAFNYCTSLVSVEIPSMVSFIADYAFDGCSSLTSVFIPSSATSIGFCAFSGCSSLKSIEIPSSVTSIGAYAFDNCYSLASVEIGDGVISIGWDAFRNCYSLEYNHYWNGLYLGNADNPFLALVGVETKDLTSCVIHEDCRIIGDEAFANCSSLESVSISSSVTIIGVHAFDRCSSLLSIVLPSSVTSIGGGAFRGCYSIVSIKIPTSVTSIDGWPFLGCPAVTIYCEAESQPSGWDPDWNSDNRPVVWGYED